MDVQDCPICNYSNPLEANLCEACFSVLHLLPSSPIPHGAAIHPPSYQPLLGVVSKSVKLLHLQSGTSITLDAGTEQFEIGKSTPSGSTVAISVNFFQNASIVSRRHASILQRNRAYYIQDMHSLNGTYLNEQRLSPFEPYFLTSGDQISLGKGNLVTFKFIYT